jgi:hypothetical protein
MSDQMKLRGRMLIGVAVFLMVIGTISYSRYSSDRAQTQLLQLRDALTLGSSQNDVERILRSEEYRQLTLVRQTPDVWIVNTPIEFGASNWCLYLTFVDQALCEITVRSTDEPTNVQQTLLRTGAGASSS